MAEIELPFAEALRLVPEFDGRNLDLHAFINKCDFAITSVKETVKPSLLKGIITKLSGRALDVIKYREITQWNELKFMLEESFGGKKTISYLQMQLNSCVQSRNEDVRSYSLRLEELQYKLINASCENKTEAESKTISTYIKSLALNIFLEGLDNAIKNIVKA